MAETDEQQAKVHVYAQSQASLRTIENLNVYTVVYEDDESACLLTGAGRGGINTGKLYVHAGKLHAVRFSRTTSGC